MALLDSARKEINAKIVYYGPGLSGKTSNIQYVYKKLKPEHRGKLMTLATQTDRTLFFDFLPVELGEIRGLRVRFQIYTVPGQVFYNATRKLVLKNVDGIIFVADSQRNMLNENIESLKNLEDNLRFYNRSIESIPFVFQYNKRDVPDLLTLEELQEKLNRWGAPSFEAVAQRGDGVLQSLTKITKLVIQKLKASPDFMAQEALPPPPAKTLPREYVPAEKQDIGVLPEKSMSAVAAPPPVVSAPEAVAGTRAQTVAVGVPAARPISIMLERKSLEMDSVDLGKPEKVSSNVFRIPISIKGHDSTELFTLTLTIEIEK